MPSDAHFLGRNLLILAAALLLPHWSFRDLAGKTPMLLRGAHKSPAFGLARCLRVGIFGMSRIHLGRNEVTLLADVAPPLQELARDDG